MDNFRGTYNEDGSIAEWPKWDIQGSDYERTATRYGIGNRQFVVLPPNFPQERIFTTLKATQERVKTLEAAPLDPISAEALRAEAEARAEFTGESVSNAQANVPAVVAPVMVEPSINKSRIRGTVTDDANAE